MGVLGEKLEHDYCAVKYVLNKSSGFANPEGAAPRPLVVDWQIHDIYINASISQNKFYKALVHC